MTDPFSHSLGQSLFNALTFSFVRHTYGMARILKSSFNTSPLQVKKKN